jgi:hypothetical protein
MVEPNFLIIGAARAGTTSLYSCLAQHPQIYMSPRKEPNFFAGERVNMETYYSFFEGVSNEIAIGEASTWYLYSKKAPERIRNHIPKVKLIAILRNPVDRAYSHFLLNLRAYREPLTSFAQAVREEDNRIHNNWRLDLHHKHMGFYYGQLKRYFDLFERNKIKIYIYEEDLKGDIVSMLQDTFRFLEVDDAFIPNIPSRYHVSGSYKNKALHALSQPSPIKSALKLLIPERALEYIKNRNLEKTEVPSEVRRQLLQEYRADITKLQDLIQRDLSVWLE